MPNPGTISLLAGTLAKFRKDVEEALEGKGLSDQEMEEV